MSATTLTLRPGTVEDAEGIEGEGTSGVDVRLPSVFGVHLERQQRPVALELPPYGRRRVRTFLDTLGWQCPLARCRGARRHGNNGANGDDDLESTIHPDLHRPQAAGGGCIGNPCQPIKRTERSDYLDKG